MPLHERVATFHRQRFKKENITTRTIYHHHISHHLIMQFKKYEIVEKQNIFLDKKKIIPLKVINKKNKGICNNLNDALSLVKGKYVCITGSDDFWSLDKLEIQVQFMESNNHVAVCSGNVIKVDSDGHSLVEDKQRLSPERTYSFKDVFMRDFPFSSTCAMIRTTVFEEVGLYDSNLKIEDYYMWLKIAHAGYSIHFQEDILGYYRIHNANTILKSWLIYTEMKKIITAYQQHKIYPQALRRLKIVYFPQIAQIDKRRAVSMLPAAISHTRFFYRGLFYLLKPLNS